MWGGPNAGCHEGLSSGLAGNGAAVGLVKSKEGLIKGLLIALAASPGLSLECSVRALQLAGDESTVYLKVLSLKCSVRALQLAGDGSTVRGLSLKCTVRAH
jgi:hypothetical protein